MRILVFSDTHKKIGACVEAMQKENYDAVIFLGDVDDDAEMIKSVCNAPFYAVKGNNDFFSLLPTERLIELDGKRIFMTHGHEYGVKYTRERIARRALELGADIALFGHTHISSEEFVLGAHLFNPGSAGYGRRTYGIIETDNGKLRAFIRES